MVFYYGDIYDKLMFSFKLFLASYVCEVQACELQTPFLMVNVMCLVLDLLSLISPLEVVELSH